MLSTKSDEELDHYLSNLNLIPLLQNAIVRLNHLQEQIKTVRKNIYVIDNQEDQIENIFIGLAIQKYR